MASAFQALPPPGPPPPGVVYPAATATSSQPSSHSNGSFGMVFIVLAVILVVSAAACALGRMCNKRAQRPPSHQPKHRGAPDERDVEFGYGRRGEPEPELEFGPRRGEPELGPRRGESEPEPELGFERRLPKVKFAPPGESRGQNGEFGGPSIVRQMRTMESPRNFR